MKQVSCDICRDVIFDKCQWHWTLQKRTLMGDKQRMHICPRCGTALIDLIMDKRREYDQPPVNGSGTEESYT